ncbi:YaaA family protein, partial [uncultured Muribaculum sp.]
LDNINPYRLEGNVELPDNGGVTMTDYWQPILTEYLIAKVKADDGILVNLASEEMKSLFDWEKVSNELTVVSPEFKVDKNGKLRTIVIYAKMCRGAMSRYILKNRITDIDLLSSFTYDGFRLIESKPRLLYAL